MRAGDGNLLLFQGLVGPPLLFYLSLSCLILMRLDYHRGYLNRKDNKLSINKLEAKYNSVV